MSVSWEQARIWMAQGRSVSEQVHVHGRLLGIIRSSTRKPIEVPDIAVQAYAWPPPARVLAPQKARFAHKKAGNANRKQKGDAGQAEAKTPKRSQGREPEAGTSTRKQKREASQVKAKTPRVSEPGASSFGRGNVAASRTGGPPMRTGRSRPLIPLSPLLGSFFQLVGLNG